MSFDTFNLLNECLNYLTFDEQVYLDCSFSLFKVSQVSRVGDYLPGR